MPSPRHALLDTSIIVGGRDVLAGVPELSSLSVITIGELRAGVALAATNEEQQRRSARFEAVRAAFAPIAVDEHVANHFGDLLAFARSSGRAQKATDLLIAATAAASTRHC